MFLSALAAVALQSGTAPHSFAAVGDHFELDGKPFVVRSGEMHYPRVPAAYWRQRLRMAKAMGLNTVCTYAFWNLHEPKPGKWDFKGNLDIARFVRIAGEEGLKVIVRPGPYICTELDFGGLPAWLLKDRSMRVRSNDPKFVALTKAYFARLGKELKPLLVQNGGPIVMTQVENEYGSYGADHAYMANVRDALVTAGFTGQLFTSDGPGQGMLGGGTLPGIPATVNFGSGAESAFRELAKFRPEPHPRMIGEYWAGWFDAWGQRHHTSSVATNLKDLEWCLKNDVSFNLYMFHGGTNWGFMQGSNGNANSFTVDVTSYDYDSALDESGRVTPKYRAFRDLLAKYTLGGLPSVPEMPSPVAIPPVRLSLKKSLFFAQPKIVNAEEPRSFEDLDLDYGLVYYETSAPVAGHGTLSLGRLMDYAIVYVDGKRVGTLDRRLNQKGLEIDVPTTGAKIGLLVEGLSRVNFGAALPDERKGIEGPVTLSREGLGGRALTGWRHAVYPFDPTIKADAPRSHREGDPAYYAGSLQVPTVGDTFLDLRGWNKGFVWVNGHNLGRFWNVGPQQTLFLPGVWLKKGANSVVVYDEGPKVENPTIQGLAQPILDDLRRAPVASHRKPGQTVDLSGLMPVAQGEWANGAQAQTAGFAGRGRYLALEVLSEHGEGPYASLAELWAQGSDGKDLSRKDWKVAYADSEEIEGENGGADNVFDLQPPTFWHTRYSGGSTPMPHLLVIDLGRVTDLTGLRALPRQDGPNGRIKGYRIYVSETPFKGL